MQPTDEVWRPIQGYVDAYEVSDHGRVRSLDRVTVGTDGVRRRLTGRIMKFRVYKKDPYQYLGLSSHNVLRTHKVHVLVVTAFYGPKPFPDAQVRHLNGNSLDNRASNLAWGTASQNVHDKVRHGGHMWANKTHCPQGHPYDEQNTTIRSGGGRSCKICDRAKVRRWYVKARANGYIAPNRRKVASQSS